jgi:hypothetical protein
MRHFVADFETTTHEKDKTRIWAYGLTEIGNTEFFRAGRTMEEFFRFCESQTNSIMYFHNLKFDGEFIIHWLLTNGYTYSKEKNDRTFNVMISKMNQFYSIEVIFQRRNKNYKKVKFLDSLKKLPFPVAKIAKDFKFDIQKLDIDYDKPRPVGYFPTREEIQYIRNDVEIVARALHIQYEQGLSKMTIGSDALNYFKEGLGKKVWERHFPVMSLEVDSDKRNGLRLSYRGGFTYLNPKYKCVDMGKGIVLDVNSLYPSVMYNCLLPYDYPIFFKGKYKPNEICPLYIQRFVCEFELKKDHIPTIQIKKGNLGFIPTEYVESSKGKPVELVLTSVDMKLFLDHYDITEMYEYIDGWMFRAKQGMFKEYIDHWMHVKENTTGSIRAIAKLLLNSLYGKFASNPDVTGKYPVLNGNVVEYHDKEEEFTNPVYTPLASFVTAYAREITIRSAQKNYDRFIYADTDSLHLIGEELPELEIHPTKLGAWDHESTFERGRFIRAKSYIEQVDGKLHVTCAGMPDNVKSLVTWENFRPLNEEMLLPCRDGYYFGKLMPKKVEGGVILEPNEFRIK